MSDSDNNPSGNTCAECGQDVSEAVAARDGVCPACGHHLGWDKSESARETERLSRKAAWVRFWCLFIAAPVTTYLSMATRNFTVAWIVAVVGTLGAGFALAALMSKDRRNFVWLGILLSVAVFATYLCVAFVGCLVIFSTARFN